MAVESVSLFDQPAKIRIQLRCPACDIDRRNIGLRESCDTLFRRFAGHAFGPVRPRIDMAMPAGLIAELADIDLKDRDPGSTKREESDAIQQRLKGEVLPGAPENL